MPQYGYRRDVNGDVSPPALADLVDEVFRAGPDRLSRAEIQIRVKEMEQPILSRLAAAMPEGNYEHYQAHAVLDQIEREEGLWRTA
jgi:hypothetical protein